LNFEFKAKVLAGTEESYFDPAGKNCFAFKLLF